MTAPLLCLLIKRMSQPVSGKLNSNKKCHGAQPAKGDGLHQKDSLRNRLATKFGNAYQQTSRVSTTATAPSRYHWPGHGIQPMVSQWTPAQEPTCTRGAPPNWAMVSSEFLVFLLPFWKGAEERLENQKVWEFPWKIRTQLKVAILPAEVRGLEVVWYVGTYRK